MSSKHRSVAETFMSAGNGEVGLSELEVSGLVSASLLLWFLWTPCLPFIESREHGQVPEIGLGMC